MAVYFVILLENADLIAICNILSTNQVQLHINQILDSSLKRLFVINFQAEHDNIYGKFREN